MEQAATPRAVRCPRAHRQRSCLLQPVQQRGEPCARLPLLVLGRCGSKRWLLHEDPGDKVQPAPSKGRRVWQYLHACPDARADPSPADAIATTATADARADAVGRQARESVHPKVEKAPDLLPLEVRLVLFR